MISNAKGKCIWKIEAKARNLKRGYRDLKNARKRTSVFWAIRCPTKCQNDNFSLGHWIIVDQRIIGHYTAHWIIPSPITGHWIIQDGQEKKSWNHRLENKVSWGKPPEITENFRVLSQGTYSMPPEVIGGRLFEGLRPCFCSAGSAIWHLSQTKSQASRRRNIKFLASRYRNYKFLVSTY